MCGQESSARDFENSKKEKRNGKRQSKREAKYCRISLRRSCRVARVILLGNSIRLPTFSFNNTRNETNEKKKKQQKKQKKRAATIKLNRNPADLYFNIWFLLEFGHVEWRCFFSHQVFGWMGNSMGQFEVLNFEEFPMPSRLSRCGCVVAVCETQHWYRSSDRSRSWTEFTQ